MKNAIVADHCTARCLSLQGAGGSVQQNRTAAWERAQDPWLVCELGNLPILRRQIDSGEIGVHDVNSITGESLLMVRVGAPSVRRRLNEHWTLRRSACLLRRGSSCTQAWSHAS